MSLVQDRPQMNYFLMRFRRTKPDESEISFVAACEEKWSPGGPKNWSKLFAHKFPGWKVVSKAITEEEFERRLDSAHEANLIDLDHRHPDELFQAVEKISGNFFDPWRFT